MLHVNDQVLTETKREINPFTKKNVVALPDEYMYISLR